MSLLFSKCLLFLSTTKFHVVYAFQHHGSKLESLLATGTTVTESDTDTITHKKSKKQSPASRDFVLQYGTSGTSAFGASTCLTVGATNGTYGIPLRMESCVSQIGGQATQPEKDAQVFTFNDKGFAQSKLHANNCIQRFDCQGSFVYNLGPCGDFTSAIFELGDSELSRRVQLGTVPVSGVPGRDATSQGWLEWLLASPELGASSGTLDEVRTLGRPAAVFNMERFSDCVVCGPFRFTQFCKGGRVEGSSTCQLPNENSNNNLNSPYLGWTRNHVSHFLPPNLGGNQALTDTFTFGGAGPPGGQVVKKRDLFTELFGCVGMGWVYKGYFGADAGLLSAEATAAMRDGGMRRLNDAQCGSTIGDGSGAESWFYFKKV